MRRGILLAGLVSVVAAGCQTLETEPVVNTWRPAPLQPAQDGRRGDLQGAPLFANARAGRTTVIEGSGRFVGESSAAVRQSAETGGEGVTLNLVNVPAPQAAKTVLGDMLGYRYTVDPGIEGKITIQTPAPIPKLAALDLFESALRANNAALVSANGHYRIVPAEQAALGTGLNTQQGPDAAGRFSSGVRVVQLKYVAAAEMRRVLEPIVSRNAIVRIDGARNQITLSGSGPEMAAMMEAVALFDVDVMRGMSFALVPVKTSQPDAIATELRTVFASDREGPMAGMVQFLPNKRLASILIISPQPQYLRRAEEWVRRLDAQAQGSEKQLFTYSVQNRRAQELVEVLQAMFASETRSGRGSASSRNVAPNQVEATAQSNPVAQAHQALGGGGLGGSGVGTMQTGARGMSMASTGPGGFGAQSRTSSSPSGGSGPGATVQVGGDDVDGPRVKIVADDAKNSILIESTPDDYRRVLRVIASLDVMPKQVLIEATIAEVTLNDDLKFGLRWNIQQKSGEFSFTDAANGALGSVYPGFSYAFTAANIVGSLNALAQITDVNVISSPTLTVMDNKAAVLQIGDQVPITTQSAISTTGIGAPVVNSVSYRDTGVILSITPRINESGRVLLDVEQEVSSVANTTSSGIDSPTIRQRKIKTSVVVNNGDALVLGGLIQDSQNITRNQVPIVGDLPVIGNAFKHKRNQLGKTELVILIAPHVMRDLNEARGITEEFRREIEVNQPIKRRQIRSLENTVRRTFQ